MAHRQVGQQHGLREGDVGRSAATEAMASWLSIGLDRLGGRRAGAAHGGYDDGGARGHGGPLGAALARPRPQP